MRFAPWATDRSNRPDLGEIRHRLDDATTAMRASTLGRQRQYLRLTGREQVLWDYCGLAVQHQPSWLADGKLTGLLTDIEDEERPASAPAVLRAADATIRLSRALATAGSPLRAAPPTEVARWVAETWAGGLGMPASSQGRGFRARDVVGACRQVPYVTDGMNQLLNCLDNAAGDVGQAMVVISAMLLAGARPDSRTAVRIPVLLTRETEGEPVLGLAGMLDLQVLPAGPPGLFPDPRALRILRGDAHFTAGLSLAWESAGSSGLSDRQCVLWRLTIGGEPIAFHLTGGSLGAPLAIALRELARRRRASRFAALALLHRFFIDLRPMHAVTGLLEGHPRDLRLGAVDEIDAKLQAAHEAGHLGVVIPRANWRPGELKVPSHIVYPANTLRDARRAVRRIRWRRVTVAAATTALILSAAVVFGIVQSFSDSARTQHQLALASELSNSAGSVRGTNPGLAAQLDVAAYRDTPDPGTYTRLLNDEDAPLDTVLLASPGAAHSVPFGSLALSQDGGAVAAVSNGSVELWDAGDPGLPTARLGLEAPRGARRFPLAFSPRGQVLATPAADGAIMLWDVADLARPVPLSPQFGAAVTTLAFSPDGAILATGEQDGTVQLWNITSPARPSSLGVTSQASSAVAELTFAAGGATLDVADQDGAVQVLSIIDPGRPAIDSMPVEPAEGSQEETSFSQNAQAVMTDSSGDVFLDQLTARSNVLYIPGGSAAPAVISPDGLIIATRDSDGSITLLNDAQQPVVYPMGPSFSAGSPSTVGTGPGLMAFDADGDILAADDGGTEIILWHLPRTETIDPSLPAGAAATGTESINGGVAALTSGSGVSVQPLSAHAGRTLVVTAPAGGGQSSAALAVGGHLLASSDGTSSITLWQLPSPTAPVHLSTLVDVPRGLALSENGQLLAAAASNGTSLWSISDPARPQALGSPFGAGASMAALSADGRLLAVLTAGQSVQLWSLANPARPEPASPPFFVAVAGQAVTAMALSPDRQTLAVATTAGTVQLWDIASRPHSYGSPLTSNSDTQDDYAVTGLDSAGVNALAYSPDGQTLTALNADSTVLVWNLQPAQAIRGICSATTRDLTSSIWFQQNLPSPFQAACPNDSSQATVAAIPGTSAVLLARLCTASALSIRVGVPDQRSVRPTVPLVLRNTSRAPCSLAGAPQVSLTGPQDPGLGDTYRLATAVASAQGALVLQPGQQAHVDLTYTEASLTDVPSGGGDPIWVPERIRLVLPGTHGVLTAPWGSCAPVLRQDNAIVPGSAAGPFLPGAGTGSGTDRSGTAAMQPPADPIAILIANQGDGTVTDIGPNGSSATIDVEDMADLFGDPVSVAFAPDGQYAYMAGSGGIGVIADADTPQPSPEGMVEAGGGGGVAVTPDGRNVLAALGSADQVAVYSGADNGSLTYIGAVNVGMGASYVAVTPDSQYAYVSNNAANTVTVIGGADTSDPKAIATLNVGDAPFGAAATPDGRYVYVANNSSDTVSVISGAESGHPQVTATLKTGAAPLGIAMAPDGRYGYVVNAGSNTVSEIGGPETAHPAIVRTLRVGDDPYAVAITPDGQFAYVINMASDTLTMIRGADTSHPAVAATYRTGSEPWDIAVYGALYECRA